jgi:Domain of unknown function (DUF4282)/zinc-ribbon domain/Protein of unknown function (DUF2510)
VTCPACGAQNAVGDRFCGACGTALGIPNQPAVNVHVNATGGTQDPALSFTTKGFFRSLYDFKFTSLIAPRWMRFIYAVLLVVITVVAVITVIASLALMAKQAGAGILLLIFVVFYYFLWLIGLRVMVEIIIVFFRIGDDVRAIRIGAVGLGQAGPVASVGTPPPVPPASDAATSGPLSPAPVGTGESWLPDPSGRYPDRWWDGSRWTQWVRDKPGGTRSEDPPVR